MSKPLTVEEMKKAADQFMPLFDVVCHAMPEGSKVDDILKVMENVAKLAQKNRAEEKKQDKFGFNKEKKDEV
jgi:hypothetical protein